MDGWEAVVAGASLIESINEMGNTGQALPACGLSE